MLSETIKTLRKQAGMSQEQLAGRLPAGTARAQTGQSSLISGICHEA